MLQEFRAVGTGKNEGARTSQFLEDQLTSLNQGGGQMAYYAHHITTCIRIFRPSYGPEFRFNFRVTTFGFQLNQDALTTKNSWKSYTQFDIARNDDYATLNNNNMMETATTDAADSVSQSTACPVKSRKKLFYPEIY